MQRGGTSSLAAVADEAPGANCSLGGRRLSVGLDANGNQALDPAEVSSVDYVCNVAGAPVTSGARLSALSSLPAGAECGAGGTRVQVGRDADADGVLDAAEVEYTTQVCNAPTGGSGGGGSPINSLVRQQPEGIGANCAVGGTRIDSGPDSNGNGLLDNGEVTATTYACGAVVVARAWQEASLVRSDNRVRALQSEVASNAAGVTYVVWFEGSDIWSSRREGGGAWEAPRQVSQGGDFARVPRVAVDAQGNAIAVWRQHNGGSTEVRAARRPAGGDWEAPQVLGSSSAGGVPAIAINASGMAMVAWQAAVGAAANRYVPGAGWGGAQLLSSGAAIMLLPGVGIDDEGNAYVAWFKVAGGAVNEVRRSDSAGTWGSVETFTNVTGTNLNSPRLGVAANGQAVLAWREASGVYARRYVPGTGWDALPQTVAAVAPDSEDSNFALAINATGTATVAWQQTDNGRENLWASTQQPAGAWSTPALIEADAGEALAVRLAMDPSGVAVAVWNQSNGTHYDARASRYVNGAWGLPIILDRLAETALTWDGSPTVAADGAGNVTVVWIQDMPVNSVHALWFAQFR